MLSIDISGPRGNAVHLIGQAETFAKQLDYSPAQIASMKADMQSRDYDHLLRVFRSHFNGFCQLVNGEEAVEC